MIKMLKTAVKAFIIMIIAEFLKEFLDPIIGDRLANGVSNTIYMYIGILYHRFLMECDKDIKGKP